MSESPDERTREAIYWLQCLLRERECGADEIKAFRLTEMYDKQREVAKENLRMYNVWCEFIEFANFRLGGESPIKTLRPSRIKFRSSISFRQWIVLVESWNWLMQGVNPSSLKDAIERLKKLSPSSSGYTTYNPPDLTPTAKKLADEIQREPGLTSKQLARKIGKTPPHTRAVFGHYLRPRNFYSLGSHSGYYPPKES